MTDPTLFQLVVTAFILWENAKDPEKAERQFREAMCEFLTPELRKRVLGLTYYDGEDAVSGSIAQVVTPTQPGPAGSGVRLQGQLYDFPVDLAALMAEGWTSIRSLQGATSLSRAPCVVLESRSPMSEEEAAARAQYAALKLRFEG